PNSSVYRTDRSLATVRHVINTPILLIWMRAIDIIETNLKRSKYAVAFFIPSVDGFHIVDLAFLLLRFQDFYIRDCDYHRFDMTSLSYQIEPHGTFGLLLYDQRLRHAYHKAKQLARQNPSKFRSAQFGHPVSIWPPDSES
ncbi:hypothetical protein B0H10DRAFT_1731519, partial [Mycena sp. CBHHK59/15]